MKTFHEAAVYEHSFWLEILRDHSTFILDSLAEREKEYIEKAKKFKEVFNELLVKLKGGSTLSSITLEAEQNALQLRDFKLDLIKMHLTSQFTIHLGATFINHMVNELEEYLLVLSYLKKNQIPPVYHELHHHLLWTLDAAGHAGAIADTMDAVEKEIKKQGRNFVAHFEAFYLKAVELTGYLRTNLHHFPALERMNKDIKLEMKIFQAFLNEIKEMELSNKVLSTFSPLMADHMMREETYYLKKLAESQNAKMS